MDSSINFLSNRLSAIYDGCIYGGRRATKFSVFAAIRYEYYAFILPPIRSANRLSEVHFRSPTIDSWFCEQWMLFDFYYSDLLIFQTSNIYGRIGVFDMQLLFLNSFSLPFGPELLQVFHHICTPFFLLKLNRSATKDKQDSRAEKLSSFYMNP